MIDSSKTKLVVTSLILTGILGVLLFQTPIPAKRTQSAIDVYSGIEIYNSLVDEGIIPVDELYGGEVLDGEIHLPRKSSENNFFGAILFGLERLQQ